MDLSPPAGVTVICHPEQSEGSRRCFDETAKARFFGLWPQNDILAVVLFLGFFALYLHQAAPSVTTGDSGEFMAAAATLGIAHAPSFPVYSLLGKAWITIIPWASIAFRLNIFSAFCSSLALLFLFLSFGRLTENKISAFLLAAAIGVTPALWLNSLVTEVFALHVLFTAVLFYCLVRFWQEGEASNFDLLFCFLLGLGLGNHHILVFMAPTFIIAAWIKRFPTFAKRVVLYFIMGTLGFSIYATLPIRSAKTPPLNWGQPTTVDKFMRTITRKDYGSLKLATGDAPERNFANTAAHLSRFARQIAREITWPVLLLCVVGYVLGIKRDPWLYGLFILIFLLTGPFFALLGNLPFNAQSDGIIGRFLIVPTFALLLGLIPLERFRNVGTMILAAMLTLFVTRGVSEAENYRHSLLVFDYGRAMLRSMPPNAIMFLDGGDDAFYSLAYLHFAEGRRPDLEFHDRGGLVFRNIYGDDFRLLTKDIKMDRRRAVEKTFVGRRPVFYSSMDAHILPGVTQSQVAFLYEVGATPAVRFSWPLLIVRSLYPLSPADYRARALACFFPYMQGRAAYATGAFDNALTLYDKAWAIGADVDWFRTNLIYDLAHSGYDALVAGENKKADMIYRFWIRLDTQDVQPWTNLGVALERLGKISDAKDAYVAAAKRFPQAVDPMYNLGVLAWKEKDWASAASYFEQTLQRKPDHEQARGYMLEARKRQGK